MYRIAMISIAALTCISCAATVSHSQTSIEQQASKRPDSVVPSGKYVEYGRYTLVNTAPRADQVDLLKQVIDIRIPAEQSASVRSAMLHVLQRTGYGLCPGSDEQRVLFSRPLPAAHYQLGPMPLGDALKVLAGTSWNLLSDDVLRTVCFERRKVVQP